MTTAKQIRNLHSKIQADPQSFGQAMRAAGQEALRLELAWHTENMLRTVKRRMYRPHRLTQTISHISQRT